MLVIFVQGWPSQAGLATHPQAWTGHQPNWLFVFANPRTMLEYITNLYEHHLSIKIESHDI